VQQYQISLDTLKDRGYPYKSVTILDNECLTIENKDELSVQRGVINRGRIINNGNITINYDGGILYNSPEKEIINNGIIMLVNESPSMQKAKLENMGTITNTGSISSNGEIYNDNSGTITNGGEISIAYYGLLKNTGIIKNNQDATIKNEEHATIYNAGGEITNMGTITNNVDQIQQIEGTTNEGTIILVQ